MFLVKENCALKKNELSCNSSDLEITMKESEPFKVEKIDSDN